MTSGTCTNIQLTDSVQGGGFYSSLHTKASKSHLHPDPPFGHWNAAEFPLSAILMALAILDKQPSLWNSTVRMFSVIKERVRVELVLPG